MLERLALAAPFNPLPERFGFLAAEGALEVQVQLHARHFQEMSAKQFGLKAGGFNIAFCEKFSAFLDRFQDGHVIYDLRFTIYAGVAPSGSIVTGEGGGEDGDRAVAVAVAGVLSRV